MPHSAAMSRFALHRVDPSNVGDLASAPALWAPELSGSDHIDVLDGTLARLDARAAEGPTLAVVGGGGLFGNPWFAASLEALAEMRGRRPNLRVVVWGAGWNTHFDRTREADPALLEVADLVGVRDRRSDWPWVPCASVLHPAFADPLPPAVPLVCFTHKRAQILAAQAADAGVPARSNAGPDVGGAIAHLASGETVVTDTYHGAYWATLLGRKVAITGAFSTKFSALLWPVPIVDGTDLAGAARAAEAFPDAYSEALAATRAFSAAVVQLEVDSAIYRASPYTIVAGDV